MRDTGATIIERGLPVTDHAYEWALALTVTKVSTSRATHELLTRAHHDAHVLGAARDRLAALAREHPDSDHIERALALATNAWLQAISAGS